MEEAKRKEGDLVLLLLLTLKVAVFRVRRLVTATWSTAHLSSCDAMVASSLFLVILVSTYFVAD